MNLYEILEVNENASEETINKIYKIQAKRYHPDLQKTDEDKKIAEEKMKKINDAYAVLSNSQKREEYDNKLKQERARIEAQNEQKIINEVIKNNQNQNQVPIRNEVQKQSENINRQEEYMQNLKYKPYSKKEFEKEYNKRIRKAKFDYYKKKVIDRLVFFIILILVLLVIYFFPPSHKYLVKLYNENEAVKMIVDIFRSIFASVFQALKETIMSI